ncbi:MAG TPA: class I SAM-dependent methyltransferase [Dehalococcoidia bacterium]|nr:class I SAM-dependent methyltransferase [Dehalococcoidia bacterium]
MGNIRGRVLDLGCGTKPYEKIIRPNCQEYIGIEWPMTLHSIKSVDVLGDVLSLPFKENSFDSIVSFEVMEHVKNPQVFMCEAMRVLRPGGRALIMTPFIWGEHEQPHDYFRYTQFGLRYLAEQAGFEVIAIEPRSTAWGTLVIHFNRRVHRYSDRFRLLRYAMLPLWLDQFVVLAFEKWDRNYVDETTGFTTILEKPIVPEVKGSQS